MTTSLTATTPSLQKPQGNPHLPYDGSPTAPLSPSLMESYSGTSISPYNLSDDSTMQKVISLSEALKMIQKKDVSLAVHEDNSKVSLKENDSLHWPENSQENREAVESLIEALCKRLGIIRNTADQK